MDTTTWDRCVHIIVVYDSLHSMHKSDLPLSCMLSKRVEAGFVLLYSKRGCCFSITAVLLLPQGPQAFGFGSR